LAAAVSVIDGAMIASNAVRAPKAKQKFRVEYRDARTLAPCNKMSRSHFQYAGAGRRRADLTASRRLIRAKIFRATTRGPSGLSPREAPRNPWVELGDKYLVGNRIQPLAFPPISTR
jgi:hypothetical protein